MLLLHRKFLEVRRMLLVITIMRSSGTLPEIVVQAVSLAKAAKIRC